MEPDRGRPCTHPADVSLAGLRRRRDGSRTRFAILDRLGRSALIVAIASFCVAAISRAETDYAQRAAVLLASDPVGLAASVDEFFAECADVSRTGDAAARRDATLALAMIALSPAPDEEVTIGRLRIALAAQDALDPPDRRTACAVAVPLARSLVRTGRVEEALAVLDDRLRRGGIDRLHAPIIDADRAVCLRALGRATEALNALASAESSLRDRDAKEAVEFHRVTRCEIHGERGQVFLELGRPDLAAPNFELENQLAAELGEPTTRFSSLLHRIHLDFARERCGSAIARIDAALEEPWVKSLGESGVSMLEVRRALALVREAIDDKSVRAAARDAAFRAAELAQREGILALEDRVAAALAAARIARITGDRTAAAGYLSHAESFVATDSSASARMRAEVLAAGLALAGAEADRRDVESYSVARARAEATLGEMLSEWDAAPRLESGLGFFQFQSRCELVVETIRAAENVDAAFESLLSVDARSRLGAGVPTSLEALREHVIGDGDLLLAWLPSVEHTALFVVSRERLERYECGGIARLKAAGDTLFATGFDTEGSADSASRLFDSFVPVAAQERLRDARRLLLYGLEFVGSIPFEGAVAPDGRPVGLAFGVTRLPSLSWAARTAARASTAKSDRVLRWVVPTLPRALAALHPELEPLTEDHANIDGFSELGGRTFVGREATLDALRHELTTKTRWLSILTHGVMDPRSARPGRLVFAADGDDDLGWLDCETVETLAPCEVVILAACRSGVGPLRRGDTGSTDLAGAFLFAGARAVVTTSQDVRVGHAATIAIETEREARSGRSPCEALAAARRRLLESGKEGEGADRRRAAFGFTIVGLGHRPVEFD